MCRFLHSTKIWLLMLSWMGCACFAPSSGSSELADASEDGTNENVPEAYESLADQFFFEVNPSKEFLFVIPEQTSLCSGFCQDRTWKQEWQMVSRIDLKPGAQVLLRIEGEMSYDWVDKVFFGPNKELLSKTQKTGTVLAVKLSPDDWEYSLLQEFNLDGQPFWVKIVLQIHKDSSATWPERIVVRNGAEGILAVTGKLFRGPGENWIDEVQAFGLCELAGLPQTLSFTSVANNQIMLELRVGPFYESCLVNGKTGCIFLVSAEVSLGDYQAKIEDRFRLIYSSTHHNWNDEYLLILDPKLSNVQSLLIVNHVYGSAPRQVIFMDDYFVELYREDLIPKTICP